MKCVWSVDNALVNRARGVGDVCMEHECNLCCCMKRISEPQKCYLAKKRHQKFLTN